MTIDDAAPEAVSARKPGPRTRVAILDDYQGVALKMADWWCWRTTAEVIVFRDHLNDDPALVGRTGVVRCCMPDARANTSPTFDPEQASEPEADLLDGQGQRLA